MSIYYKQGVISINHGSATVSGTDTNWLLSGMSVSGGEYFRIQHENTLYKVESIDSDTQLTLTSTYINKNAENVVGNNYTLIEGYDIGQYKTGTIAISHNSTYVSGSFTNWDTVEDTIPSGAMFMVRGEQDFYTINSIYSADAFELDQPYRNSNNYSIQKQNYSIVRDYTENYGLPLIVSGDYNWTLLLSRALNMLDNIFYVQNCKLKRFEITPSGSFYSVSGGEYYVPHSSIRVYPPNVTLFFDGYYRTFLFSDGSMVSAAPVSGNVPVWYVQWNTFGTGVGEIGW